MYALEAGLPADGANGALVYAGTALEQVLQRMDIAVREGWQQNGNADGFFGKRTPACLFN